MKIKSFLASAMMALVAVMSFSSCEKDPINNIVSEFKLIDDEVAAVKAKSGNDKAILLVAFGSTWDNAFKAFDSTKAAYERAFPGYDVFVSFSSDICINRASIGENEDEKGNIVKRDYYAPIYWLHGIGASEYDEIRVQSLQVIPGEEFAAVVASVKKFCNNGFIKDAHLDDEYLANVEVHLGLPLLADAEEDVKEVAKQLHIAVGSKASTGIVAFMGHGNPDSYDTFKANIRYNQLEAALQANHSANYFVGCVDQPENFKTQVYDRMKAAGKTSGQLYLFPLMSIAGDHAHNDMGGDDGADVDPKDWEYNDEGEIEDLSWKIFFQKLGYTCPDSNCTMKGLLEIEGVRNVWINHTREAELLEDAYHSMFPEE